jgi:NTE family protein
LVDGGVRSVANADLAAGYERVVIVAPVARGMGHMTSPRRQAAALAAAGARVVLVRPDRAAAHAIGRNVRAGRPPRQPAGPRPERQRLRSGQSGRPMAGRPLPSRQAGST